MKKSIINFILANIFMIFLMIFTVDSIYAQPIGNILEIGFTPSTSCRDMILNTINKAEHSIDIAIYSWTDTDIMDLLNEQRYEIDSKVRILMDNQQAAGKKSVYPTLKKLNFNVILDRSKVMHNKVLIVDQKYVVTGSYNWSTNAMKNNDENCLLIEDTNLYYHNYFERLWKKYNN